MNGWVYILSNPAMPDLLKIGYTDREPFSRAKEIGQATGVPYNFVVEYQIYVTHPYEVEQKTHQQLYRYRVNTNREFFSCSYEDAVEAIRASIAYFEKQYENFTFGSEVSHKIEKAILEQKLAEKQRKIREEQKRKALLVQEAKE